MTTSKIPLAAAALALVTALPAGCAGDRRRPPPESAAESAVPVGDPTAHGTPSEKLAPGLERVAVKLERRPDGGVRVLEFLSPDLTESERTELRDAIERGDARPETGPAPNTSTWTTWVVRKR